MFVRFILNVLLVNSLAIAASSQLVSEEYCNTLVDLIATPLKPVHWYRHDTFTNDCQFAFDIDKKGGVGVTFGLERFKTQSEARREFASTIRMFDNSKFKLVNGEWMVDEKDRRISLGKKFWDGSAVYNGVKGPFVLHKKRTVITLFCDQKLLCSGFERLLTENPKIINF